MSLLANFPVQIDESRIYKYVDAATDLCNLDTLTPKIFNFFGRKRKVVPNNTGAERHIYLVATYTVQRPRA
jgi:hypothetical protein